MMKRRTIRLARHSQNKMASVWKSIYANKMLELNDFSEIFLALMMDSIPDFKEYCSSLLQKYPDTSNKRRYDVAIGRAKTSFLHGGMVFDIFRDHSHEFDQALDIFNRLVHKNKNKYSSYEMEVERRLKNLQDVFSLKDSEIDLIRYFYHKAQDDSMENLFREGISSVGAVKYISGVSGIKENEIIQILNKSGRIRNLGIFEMNGSNILQCSVSNEVEEFLQGTGNGDILNRTFKKDRGRVYNLSSFSITDEERENTLSLLSRQGRANILLYGTPGTGKTELARSLGRRMGKDVYFIGQGDTGSVFEIKLALEGAAGSFNSDEVIIVMDEADQVLNTSPQIPFFFMERDIPARKVHKGWINEFLDRSNQKIIWISNEVNGMDHSVRRRFDYSIHFSPFTSRERIELWKRIINKHPLRKSLDNDFIKIMSANFPVNASGITGILESVSRIPGIEHKNPEEVQDLIRGLTEKQVELITGKTPAVKRIEKKLYDPSVLKTSESIASIQKIMSGYRSAQKRSRKNPHSLNMLFYGIPGTGKTEFARQLTKNLGMDLIVKKASDLLDPYVGMTEKYIAQAFAEAKKADAVLLIDEIDTFLRKRTGESRSWEISHVNEFLTRMESFNGIFIGTSNLKDDLDSAALRRFSFKVEFHPMDDAGKLALFTKYAEFYFPEDTHLIPNDDDLKGLRDLDVTPGDYHAVFSRIRYLDGKDLSPAKIAGEIREEVLCKKKENTLKKKIGFGQ